MKQTIFSWFLIGIGAALLLAAMLLSLPAEPASAQCGDIPTSTSCYACHEEQQAYPVYGKGDWHDIHAAKDCCWNCHGGNTQSNDKELAHVGMTTQPLKDIFTDCYGCHPQDYEARAVRFALLLGVTPESRPTPTPHPLAAVVDHPIVLQPPPVQIQASQSPWFGLFAGLLILLVFLTILFLISRLSVQNSHVTDHANNV